VTKLNNYMIEPKKATLRVFGDTLEVFWDGHAWAGPADRSRHSECRDAMRVELERNISASGDDPAGFRVEDMLDCIVED